ncbi:MAG: pyrroline-5-carboxylate reductase [Nanoarchaeota archaeon]|nr:pyrroline-5-carboxylate reductase [Nanoarchaeota archaeon]
MKKTIGVIGCGKMGEALISSLLKAGYPVICFEKDPERLDFVKKKHGIESTNSIREMESKADVLLLAVKPQDFGVVLSEVVATRKLIISIAAGIMLQDIQKKLKDARVVRVMPNVACTVGEMAAGYCCAGNVADEDKALVKNILDSAGKSYKIDEAQMDALSAISGSGPAFFAEFVRSFTEAGEKNGISKELAADLAVQTMLGTAKMLSGSGFKAEELINMVCSPNGTTMEGMKVLEKAGIERIISDVVSATMNRSREIRKGK